ncbi:MAG: hypothetical protein RI894_653, partial [Bacteroidota bacterium]
QAVTYLNGEGAPIPDPDLPLTIWVDLDQVTDARAVGLSSGDVYLWTWIDGSTPPPPVIPAKAPNGTWAASNSGQKMTRDATKGPNVYRFDYLPDLKTYFQSPDQVAFWGKNLGCLAKNADGTKQTEDFKNKIPAPIIGPQLLVTHPVRWLQDSLLVTPDDVITFKFNSNLDTAAFRQNLPPNSMYCVVKVTFDDGTFLFHSPYNGAAPYAADSNPALLMRDVAGNEHHLSFIPSQFFEQADCPNAAQFAAKRTAGLHIVKIEMQPYKQRATPGSGAFQQPFLPKYSFFIPKY